MKLSLLCLAVLSTGLSVIADANLATMKPTFKQELGYKNIAFGALVGGSSHIVWALSIGEELAMRGHNFTFVTVVSVDFNDKTTEYLFFTDKFVDRLKN